TSTKKDGFFSMVLMSDESTITMQRLESAIILLAYLLASGPIAPVLTMTITLLLRTWVNPTSFATSSSDTLAVFLHCTCQREKTRRLLSKIKSTSAPPVAAPRNRVAT